MGVTVRLRPHEQSGCEVSPAFCFPTATLSRRGVISHLGLFQFDKIKKIKSQFRRCARHILHAPQLAVTGGHRAGRCRTHSFSVAAERRPGQPGHPLAVHSVYTDSKRDEVYMKVSLFTGKNLGEKKDKNHHS